MKFDQFSIALQVLYLGMDDFDSLQGLKQTLFQRLKNNHL